MEVLIKRKDIPPQRRRQILAAARELFSRSGYHGVSVDAIAQHAGISKGNLYWYFKSKQEIFKLLLDDAVEQLFLPLLGIMESDLPPREKLRAFAIASLDSAEANIETMHLMWQITAQPELRDLLSSEYTLWMTPFIDYLKPLFAEIGEKDPEGISMLYAFTLDALTFVLLLGPGLYDKDKLMAAFEEKFINTGRERDVQA